MQSFLKDPVGPALPHALPFRVVFEEFRRRRETDFLAAAAALFPASLTETSEERLLTALLAQETAYEDLAKANKRLEDDPTYQPPLDDLFAACHATDIPLKHMLHRMKASALCLSGGGIRSASFCLGVLEGLSTFSRTGNSAAGLMDNLDFLSTVSGGGYIGSWMMAWVYRRHTAFTKPDWKTPYREVISALAGKSNVTAGDPEPSPVRHLRSYTSFLAPALGLTLDTFTLAAIVARNLIVNWTMLVPLLFAVTAALECSGFLFLHVHAFQAHHFASVWHHRSLWRHFDFRMEVAVASFYLIAAFAIATALPSHVKTIGIKKIFGKFSVGVFLAAALIGSWLLSTLPSPGPSFQEEIHALLGKAVIALLAYSCIAASIWRAYSARINDINQRAADNSDKLGFWRRKWVVALLALFVAIIISLFASALLLLLQREVFPHLITASHHPWLPKHNSGDRLFLVFALPLILTVLMISTTLFCALLGIFEMEEDREWWVRGGGFFLAFSLTWILANSIAFYGQGGLHRVIAGIAGLVIGLAGSATGYSGVTAVGVRPIKEAQLNPISSFLQKHNLILPAVGAVALCLIAIGAVAAEEAIRKAFFLFPNHRLREIYGAFALFVLSTFLAVLINFAININLFSLHGMYRMRLMRAFLGASNFFRHPDPFTRFDPRDTPYEADLPSSPGAPIHIINTTLNLVGTKNTAWSQRKAESFTFSPVCCGGWHVGYVPTEIYGGSRGVTLATALSISGAAFNPNMGYQSSPLLSLLMTFFNLRLGYWLPNPAQPPTPKFLTLQRQTAFFHKAGPSFALRPLIEEALGQTDDTFRWIQLTDGGHFENLGLYEMVLRRCKRIIVVDAGADPKCYFEDLGNAIRKIRIDLGIPIEFPHDLKMHAGMEPLNSYCVVANISYDCVDQPEPGQTPTDLNGTLVYIKASVTGLEPADILQYAKTHTTFPNETTANQFFNESQFESYRHLGSYAVQSIASRAPQALAPDIESFTAAANSYWEGPI